jgi:hypothetical protein
MKKLTEKELNRRATKLREGTIWESNSGTVYKVVTIANDHVPSKVKAKYPMTVVFLNASNVVFAKTVDDFISSYSFVEEDINMKNAVDLLFHANLDGEVPSLDEIREAQEAEETDGDYEYEDLPDDEDEDEDEENLDVEVDEDEEGEGSEDDEEDGEEIQEVDRLPVEDDSEDEEDVEDAEEVPQAEAIVVSFSGNDSTTDDRDILNSSFLTTSVVTKDTVKLYFKDKALKTFIHSHVNRLEAKSGDDTQVMTWNTIITSGKEIGSLQQQISFVLVGGVTFDSFNGETETPKETEVTENPVVDNTSESVVESVVATEVVPTSSSSGEDDRHVTLVAVDGGDAVALTPKVNHE